MRRAWRMLSSSTGQYCRMSAKAPDLEQGYNYPAPPPVTKATLPVKSKDSPLSFGPIFIDVSSKLMKSAGPVGYWAPLKLLTSFHFFRMAPGVYESSHFNRAPLARSHRNLAMWPPTTSK